MTILGVPGGRSSGAWRGIVACLTFAAICALAVGCKKAPVESMVAVSGDARPYFLRHVVTDSPPGGAECCTDVAAIADIDGDGYLDAVIGGERDPGSGLAWYDFPTWTRHDVGHGEFTTDGEAVDFDGDGDVDIVVGDSGAGVVWFENLESGARWQRHVVGTDYAHDIEIADLDGDSRMDIVMCDKKVVELWQAVPDGTFRRQQLSDEPGEGLLVVDLDADGDPDVLYSNHWFENRRSAEEPGWSRHPLAPEWPVETRIQAADMDGNGRLDVVLSASESEGRLSWFESEVNSPSGRWKEHSVTEQRFTGAHSLRVADFDLDGRPDILIAEMHTSPLQRVMVNLQDAGSWRGVLLATHGSHNVAAADVDGDGDTDLIAKNYAGEGRVVEYWENRAADLRLVPFVGTGTAAGSAWEYQPLDTKRPGFDLHKFGLLLADVNADGSDDVVAGSTVYCNPSNPAIRDWSRSSFGNEQDAIHVTSQTTNGWHTILAVDPAGISLVSRTSGAGVGWTRRQLHELPPGRTQGFASGPTRADGTYDLFFTRGTALFRLQVPPDPVGQFLLELISDEVEESGVDVADLDADGDSDVVTVDGGGRRIVWFEAEADGSWRPHYFGASLHWFDRVAVADVDGDGRLDVVFTEETGDWDFNARVGWLAAPADQLGGHWQSHTVAVLRSINSLAVRDVNSDGKADLVVGEHTDMRGWGVADDTFTGIFLNRGDGRWDLDLVDVGARSSHMGMLATELEPGYVDVLSVGWDQSCCVHRWRKAVATEIEVGHETTGKGVGN